MDSRQARNQRDAAVQAGRGREERLKALRQWKERETLRIAVRDLTGRASLEETVAALSEVAELTLEAVLRELRPPAKPAFGIIGMGKLGGRELNYCSDVDLLFAYETEESVRDDHGHARGAHDIFERLGQQIIQVVSEQTQEGQLFRIDLRLRPEGRSGPLTRSVESYENYYAAWGQTWERLALIKARPVAGDGALGEEFVEAVQSFRYPRSVSSTCMEEIAEQKRRIEEEILGEDQLARNVKLGAGGIREIEFIVQTLQLLHAGRNPFLQEANTLRALARLSRYNVLPEGDAEALGAAYRHLRAVEHRLQMEAEQQTHTIPDEPGAQLRLARLLGFKTEEEFFTNLSRHTAAVRAVFQRLLPARGARPARTGSSRFAGALERLAQGPGFGHVPAEAQRRLEQITPALEKMAARLGDPEMALTQLAQYADAYGARSTLFESFAANLKRLEGLLLLFDASSFLGRLVIAHPDWLDDAIRPDVLRRPLTAAQIEARLADFCRPDDGEKLRTFWQAEMLRIGLRDLLAGVGQEQIFAEISALSEALIRFSWPGTPSMAAIALGKFGGRELGYGADTDLLILTTGGMRQFHAAERAVRRWLEFLQEARGTEPMLAVDLRLRPEGEKGTLVSTLDTFRAYHRGRAEFWERQMLTRARFVAGNPRLGRDFLALAAEIALRPPLTAADLEAARHMRLRIERERSRGGAERDFKTGRGGLVDIEFIAQLGQMGFGVVEPNTPRALDALAGVQGAMGADEARAWKEHYRFLRRLEAVLSRREGRRSSEWPGEPAEQAWLAAQCGRRPQALGRELNRRRTVVREMFERALRRFAAGLNTAARSRIKPSS